MTGLQFYTYVLAKFKRTDKESEVYEAITDTVRDMKLQILAEEVKEEAYTASISTLGDYRLALPEDFGHIIGNVTVIDSATNQAVGELVKVSKPMYDRLYPERLLTGTSQNRGVPFHFTIYANQIYLGGVPDKTSYRYQINYTTESGDDIIFDTAEVPFTPNYRNYLRHGVLAEMYDGLGLLQEAQYHRGEYFNGLKKLSQNDEFNTRTTVLTKYRGM